MLPAPAPRKSRSTSAGLSGSDRNERVVAAVCTITTTVITKASGTQPHPFAPARCPGKVGLGQRGRHIADHLHALGLEAGDDHRKGRGHEPDQRARNFCADHLGGRAPWPARQKPMQMVVRLDWPRCCADRADAIERRPGRRFDAEARPAIARRGCARRCRRGKADRHRHRQQICDAAELENPARHQHGADDQARARSHAPHNPASRWAGEAQARPPAKIGVMVEIGGRMTGNGLPPSMAKPTRARHEGEEKPICGSKPPSRAVAICSGIAIAASVSPAIRSAGRETRAATMPARRTAATIPGPSHLASSLRIPRPFVRPKL